MAEGIKKYQIVINGLTESISQVESLNNTLKTLEERINALSSKKVNVAASTSSGGGSKSSSSAVMSEEVALQKELNALKNEGTKLEAKQTAYQDESYQKVLAQKDILKEIVNDQKAIAAQERLQADTYSNTMNGMKQKLADLKASIANTDLGDSDQINKMTKEANELANKLKEMEEAYGQFGRNVGNYKSAFDGLEKVTVTINGITQEFNNLMQAQKALKNGLGTLEIQGKKDTKMYKEMEQELERVSKAQLRLNSTMKDAKTSSKAMDELLDTFESFTALQQIGNGLSTFFGFDSAEIEKQIAKLVALQNTLQGIEKLRQQLNTKEGIGGWLAKGSDAVDTFVMKITGARKKMGMLVSDTRGATIAVQNLSRALKLVGGAAVVGGVMLLTTAIGKLIDDYKKWKTGGYEVGTATEVLNKNLETFQKTIDKIKTSYLNEFFEGLIDYETYATKTTELLTDQISSLLNEIDDLEKRDFSKPTTSILGGINLGYGATEDEALVKAKQRFIDLADKLNKLENDSKKSEFVKWIRKIAGFGDDVERLQREFQDLGESISKNLLYEIKSLTDQARKELSETGKVTEKTRIKINELILSLDYSSVNNSILENVDKFSKKGQYYVNQINTVKGALKDLAKSMGDSFGEMEIDPGRLEQLKIDAMKDGFAKRKAQIELNRKKELADAAGHDDLQLAINAKFNRELIEAQKTFNRQYASAYADLQSIKIEILREGWEKQKAELQHEESERIRSIVESEQLVGERSAAIRALYKKKMIEAERDWAYEMLKINEDLVSNIERVRKDAFSTEESNAQQSIEIKTNNRKETTWSNIIEGNNPNDIETRKKYFDEMLKIDEWASKKQQSIREDSLYKQNEYDTKEEERRHKAVVNAETTSLVMAELSKIPEPTDEDFAKVEAKIQEQLLKMRGELVDAYNAGKIDFKTFVEYIEREEDAHNAKMNALQKNYSIQSSAITQQNLDEVQQLYNNYYTNTIALIRTKQDEISREIRRTPVADNGWGVVQLSVTSREYDKALEGYENLKNEIVAKKVKLKFDLLANKIKPEDFFLKDNELDASLRAVDVSIKVVKEKQKNLIGDFLQSINTYVQTGLQSIQTIMQAFQTMQDAEFDKQQEAIDKENKMLEDKLDKQNEIIEQHKNNVDSIEDELANSRGERRQHLIDQLNAEMEKQREAQKEKQRLEKKKEANERKQEALDKQRKKAEYKRNLLQILVSTAMAAANGYATQPFVPVGLAMGSLALALGAVQYAAAEKAKPYAQGGKLDGGVAVGPRHRDGGIKVLGGRSEIEGGEFITNRVSTQYNTPLLEFINSKKKRVDVSDMIDFYSSGKVKKNIASLRTKYEDGGYIPTLPNSIDIREQLQNVVVNQDNRPIYVTVTDIENKMEDVRHVRTLAGLND